MTQLKLVQARASVQIYRQVDYVMNKVALHIGIGLLNGFSWWMIVNCRVSGADCSFTQLTPFAITFRKILFLELKTACSHPLRFCSLHVS